MREEKAPGSGGIGLEFCKVNRIRIQDDIVHMIRQMLLERKVSAQQKHGVSVCLPKASDRTIPGDFRPVTLFNTVYKIMARIIAYRLRSVI
jgi:hypothetical protein